ncbi:hypothetical protein GLAREA_06445 [Glarea lozoyensis ATCC 20868]|uniref:Uncharacterized protein n=1 Tax=Glarea lozoyensis (strain ATCC 20868 / MF5171) TaxID=1116229 RepID=S3D4R2_GLAL2|nr:uncharacterized protein GLAREA_06445 [Glarea lozoyensis ATCC 20868]EPE33432.1 hypothetical protein GLAREA_06445 [Glarea lozoyensis ATCC 20868]
MLPEYDVDNSDVSIDSGFTLRRLALDDASSSSSRFLALNYVSEVSTPTVEGRVTFTSLLVPGKVEERAMWRESLSCFQTPDPLWSNSSELWFWVLMEDDSMQEKFGKLEQSQQTQGESQARTIFCHFTVWRYTNADPEEEGAIAADPQAWKEELDGVMPPVTAWHQERWDFRPVPELR